MARWLVKSDPETYGLADLERDGRTVWDGVTNPVALGHLRSMQAGDQVLVYHTGGEKAIVGLARVASGPRPDPKKKSDPKLVVVDLEFVKRVPRPVTLAALKADPAFADFALVRQARLSVMPVPTSAWSRLLALAGVS